MRSVASISLILVSIARAEAADTGNSMITACKQVIAGPASPDAGYCLGSVSMLGAIAPFLDDEFAFCPPAKATMEQAVRVVVKYLEDHPAELDRPFSFIALHALRRAWPCEGPTPRTKN